MRTRKISADYIYPIHQPRIKNGVIILDEKGTVLEVLKSSEGLTDVEKREGIICPGFVNTHCHLELSHMKGKVSEGNELKEFIIELQTQREVDSKLVQQAIIEAEKEMIANGIVAVGDISNGTDTFLQKAKKNLYYHTFIELYGFVDEQAESSFNNGLAVQKAAEKLNLLSSLVPHSPYAASPQLIKKIVELKENHPISIHNQETEGENSLFINGTGSMLDLMHWFGLDTSFWKPTQQTSLRSIKSQLPSNSNLLLVHNTLTTPSEIAEIQSYNKNAYWCFCPNANWYIERKQPNYQSFIDTKAKITLGTDSLSSNWKLSILSEMQRVKLNNPTISTAILLEWATINGASFLDVSANFGTLEKGKIPGVNLISKIKNGEITAESSVERLL